ncbi:MAG TPA: hypothetical protein VIU12_28920 [Chryseolinea sp.]
MRYFLMVILFMFPGFLSGQPNATSTIAADTVMTVATCQSRIIKSKLRINNKKFVDTEPVMLQIQNGNNEYGIVQTGKCQDKIFFYFKVMVNNVCLKNQEAIELYYDNGKIRILQNEFPVNCEGNFVRILSKREVRAIRENKIRMIRLYTFRKDYLFALKDSEYTAIAQGLQCLRKYRFRR